MERRQKTKKVREGCKNRKVVIKENLIFLYVFSIFFIYIFILKKVNHTFILEKLYKNIKNTCKNSAVKKIMSFQIYKSH